MDDFTLLAYKNRLLNAGVRYAVVRRNLRELRDHHLDLQQQALLAGLNDAEAMAAASDQIGDHERLVAAMIERSELRSKLHRFPIGTTVLLPLLAHFFICALFIIGILMPLVFLPMTNNESSSFNELMNSQPQWLVICTGLSKILLMYVVTPILGCVFAFISIRSHVPRRFWLAGCVLLCLVGSSLHVNLAWPDPVTEDKGVVGVSYGPAFGQPLEQQMLTYTLRFTFNLLLCSCFAWHYHRKEQTREISGQLL